MQHHTSSSGLSVPPALAYEHMQNVAPLFSIHVAFCIGDVWARNGPRVDRTNTTAAVAMQASTNSVRTTRPMDARATIGLAEEYQKNRSWIMCKTLAETYKCFLFAQQQTPESRQAKAPGGGRKSCGTLIAMDTPQQGAQITPQRPHRLKRFFVFLCIAIVIVALGWLVYNTLRQTEPIATDEDVVESPDITSMAQVADYTGDKDLPAVDPSIVIKPFDDKDHIYGSANAPIALIEYSNFGNKYAVLFHPEAKKIVDNSNGQVQWVYRHFPMSESDFVPGEAAECVFKQLGNAGFWSFFQAAYALTNRSIASLGTIAQAAGANRADFDACMNDHVGRPRVIGQAQDASLDANVTVSPSYVIYNKKTGESRMATGLNTVEYINAVIQSSR